MTDKSKTKDQLIKELTSLRRKLKHIESGKRLDPQKSRSQENDNSIYQTMLNTTNLLVAYMDRDFNFIWVNKGYAAADKKPQDFFPGKNHFALFPNKEIFSLKIARY